MKTLAWIAGSFCGIFLLACNPWVARTVYVKSPSQASGDQSLMVSDQPGGEWKTLSSNISGFEARPGYAYTLEIKERNGTQKLVSVTDSTRLASGEIENPVISGLFQYQWVLSAYGQQGRPARVMEGTEITLNFTKAENSLTGNAGCNGYGGKFEVDENQLRVGMLYQTEKWCAEPKGIMDQEKNFLDLLKNSESFEQQGRELTISATEGRILFFEAREG